MERPPGSDGQLLIRRNLELVAESTSRINDLIANAFWIIDGSPWVDLRHSDRGDVWADGRETIKTSKSAF